MLYDLVHMDISGVNFDRIERNGALFQQQIRSMDSITEYWYHKLQDGYILPDVKDISGGILRKAFPDDWTSTTDNSVISQDQYEDYLIYCKNRNKHFIESDTAFGDFFAKKLKIKKKRATVPGQGRKPCRLFPDLAECKRMFANIFQVKESDIFDQEL